MKRCVLDGSRLVDAAAVYRALREAFHLPEQVGSHPDALWDALGDYSGEPIVVIWRNAALSAERLGAQFAAILGALQGAAAQGRLSLELA